GFNVFDCASSQSLIPPPPPSLPILLLPTALRCPPPPPPPSRSTAASVSRGVGNRGSMKQTTANFKSLSLKSKQQNQNQQPPVMRRSSSLNDAAPKDDVDGAVIRVNFADSCCLLMVLFVLRLNCMVLA
ncbi:hypothetical protein Drorol1_Dr00002750, partial [Drosera rotundifolia]